MIRINPQYPPPKKESKPKSINLVGVVFALLYGIAGVLALMHAMELMEYNSGEATNYIITAIALFILAIGNGIAFSSKTLPKAPDSINMDNMTSEELQAKLQRGYDDIEAGRVQDAARAFTKSKKKH